MEYVPTIGIEMHCEMKSNSKVFSPAANTYSKHSDTHVSPIDMGLPGVLPTLNKECVRKSIMMASILNCEIPDVLYFDRKNYYYPDLPKGYQISQSHAPIGINGEIEVPYQDTTLKVKIHDIHLEEDSAKMEHLEKESLINYNRSGVPLLELVTEPVFHSVDETIAFLEYIRRVYQFTGISDADMKKGQIRCDVNVSINQSDGSLGTKVEIKNVNSFSNIEKVLECEMNRQIRLIEAGKRDEIEQETRRFDESSNSTIRMRSKVDAIDYKYFVEPNIPKIKIDPEWVKEIQSSIIELPLSRRIRYQKLGLASEDIKVLLKERAISDYFDECITLGCEAKMTSSWITSILMANLKEDDASIENFVVQPKDLALLLNKVADKTISNKQAKEIFEKVLGEGISMEDAIKTTDSQISDETYLEELVKSIVEAHPSEVEAYKNGRTNLFNFFVGNVMKETKGKANPVLTKEIIEKYLQ